MSLGSTNLLARLLIRNGLTYFIMLKERGILKLSGGIPDPFDQMS